MSLSFKKYQRKKNLFKEWKNFFLLPEQFCEDCLSQHKVLVQDGLRVTIPQNSARIIIASHHATTGMYKKHAPTSV